MKFLLILLVGLCSAQVYNWNIKAVERNPRADGETDFDDELKLQSALSNEIQQQKDILEEMPDKSNRNVNKQQNLNAMNLDSLLNEDLQKDSTIEESSKKNQDFWDSSSSDISDNQQMQNLPVLSDKQITQFLQNYNQFNENENQNLNTESETFQDVHNPHINSDSASGQTNLKHHQNYQQMVDIFNAFQQDPNFDEKTKDDNDDAILNYTAFLQNGIPNQNVQNENQYSNPFKSKFEEEIISSERQNKNGASVLGNNADGFQAHAKSSAKEELKKVYNINNFLGSNLFENIARKCLTRDDVILLTIRRDFESLMPKDLPQCLLNDQMVAVLMNYFYVCHRIMSTVGTDETKVLVLKSFFDALGGYLNFYLVPVAKYSFYAGQLALETTDNMLRLHQQCKNYLNTNGNGWKAPIKDVLNELRDVSIEPLDIDEERVIIDPVYCMSLDIHKDNTQSDKEQMLVPLPRLELNDFVTGQLGNIWLPFRRKRVYDLKSPKSAYIVATFYETVAKCYLYQGIKPYYYEQKFLKWISENLNPHLSDDVFYPGLGAVLRVTEWLKRTSYRARYNYDQTWENIRVPQTIREKKSNHFNKMKSSGHIKKKHKNNLKEKSNIYQEQSSLTEAKQEHDNSYKSQVHYVSPDQRRLAEAVLEEQTQLQNEITATEGVKYLSMTAMQWLVIVATITLITITIASIIIIIARRRKRRKSKEIEKNLEEEPLLDRNSNSVQHGKYNNIISNRYKAPPHLRYVSSSAAGSTGSSSSLVCSAPGKCFAFKRASKGPPIIETTSIDYSSSETEDMEVKKAHMKAHKIDEKTRKEGGEEKTGKKPKKNTKSIENKNSWETIYSS